MHLRQELERIIEGQLRQWRAMLADDGMQMVPSAAVLVRASCKRAPGWGDPIRVQWHKSERKRFSKA